MSRKMKKDIHAYNAICASTSAMPKIAATRASRKKRMEAMSKGETPDRVRMRASVPDAAHSG